MSCTAPRPSPHLLPSLDASTASALAVAMRWARSSGGTPPSTIPPEARIQCGFAPVAVGDAAIAEQRRQLLLARRHVLLQRAGRRLRFLKERGELGDRGERERRACTIPPESRTQCGFGPVAVGESAMAVLTGGWRDRPRSAEISRDQTKLGEVRRDKARSGEIGRDWAR